MTKWTPEIMNTLKAWGDSKRETGMDWQSIADEMNRMFGLACNESTYRKRYNELVKGNNALSDSSQVEDMAKILDDIRKETITLRDERTNLNAYIRRISREESIKQIAESCAKDISSRVLLDPPTPIRSFKSKGSNIGLLMISDWHYGIEIDNYWNKYDPEIAKHRILNLRTEVAEKIKTLNLSKLIVANLGDLIAGRIHSQIRIQSRFDVIQQTIQISEILAEFLNYLSEFVDIDYYDCIDNHSRVEPNKKESMHLESLALIIPWFLKTRLKANKSIKIKDNEVSPDIITIEELGYRIAGVHGDVDKPSKIIDNISMMTREKYDLIISAHNHHFSANEKNECILLSNSSLMGTDEYAERLRLSAKPSQLLIVMNEHNVTDSIHRILVE